MNVSDSHPTNREAVPATSKQEEAYERFIASIPEQAGKTAILTSATSGIGLAAARVLASRGGADVVIASRNAEKGKQVVEDIRASKPSGSVKFSCLDTASLEIIRDFTSRWEGRMFGRVFCPSP